MRRTFLIFLIITIFLSFLILTCKKKEEDNGEKEDVSYNSEYRKSLVYFKEVYKSIYIDEKIDSDTISNADKFLSSWQDVSDNFKDNPPGKYADDEDWDIWVEEMKIHSDDINNYSNEGDIESIKGEIREVQKLILDLDERNNDLSAIDEIIQFDLYIDDFLTAKENKDGDEQKRVFMRLQRTLDRLFTAVTPDTAKEDESLYDDMKNELYDNLKDFEQAESQEERMERLESLKNTSHELYYNFG